LAPQNPAPHLAGPELEGGTTVVELLLVELELELVEVELLVELELELVEVEVELREELELVLVEEVGVALVEVDVVAVGLGVMDVPVQTKELVR
jgi:hypothetical protein